MKLKHAFISYRQNEKMERRKRDGKIEGKNEQKLPQCIRAPAVGDVVGTAVGAAVGPENSRKKISRQQQ